MKSSIKALARSVLGDYALYQIWTVGGKTDAARATGQDTGFRVREIGRSDVEAAPEASLRDSAWYLGDDANGFGCFSGNELLGVAYYWHGQRYLRRRSVSISIGAAKLVHIATAPAMRSRGVATLLIVHSAAAMQALGFHPLYARIWHSNHPSQRAFASAGWRATGWLVQINPLRRRQPWTFQL